MGFAERYKVYAPVLVRVALGIVFLWFGLNQLINPESFLGYVPEWFYPHGMEIQHEHPLQMLHSLPLAPHAVIMGNGAFETLFGSLLLLGVFTRAASLLLSINLFAIALSLGYNDVAVRDLGLALITLAVFLHGQDKLCLDSRLKRLKKQV